MINDPAVEVCWTQRDVRPATSSARLDSEGVRAAEAMVKKVYDTVTLPTMSTGATDMAHIAIRNASSRTRLRTAALAEFTREPRSIDKEHEFE